jgi:hypothetical protein
MLYFTCGLQIDMLEVCLQFEKEETSCFPDVSYTIIKQEISLPSRKNTLPTSNLHTQGPHPKGSNPQHVKCSNFSPRIDFIKHRKGIICEYLAQHKIKGPSFVWPLNWKTPRRSYALNVCVPSYFLLGAKSLNIPTTWNQQHSSQFSAIGLTEHS